MARFDLNAAFFGGPGFTLYHAWGPNGGIPLTPHFHDEYLICVQLSGREECHVSGRLQSFAPGDVVLINPQQVHTGNASASPELEYISLYVDRAYVRRFAHSMGAATDSPEFTQVRVTDEPELARKLEDLLGLVRERDGALLYPLPQTPREEDVEPLSSLIPRLDPRGPRDTNRNHDDHEDPSRPDVADSGSERLAIESALDDVLAHAFASFSNLRQPMLRSTNRVGHRKIARVVEHLRALPPATAAACSLDELAEIAELSKFHFLRQFSQVVGMTPGAYIRTLRLCHAARKLRTSDQPIVEIALSVGFADHPSFSRAFARHMGMTPSDYQKLGPL